MADDEIKGNHWGLEEDTESEHEAQFETDNQQSEDSTGISKSTVTFLLGISFIAFILLVLPYITTFAISQQEIVETPQVGATFDVTTETNSTQTVTTQIIHMEHADYAVVTNTETGTETELTVGETVTHTLQYGEKIEVYAVSEKHDKKVLVQTFTIKQ